MTSARCGKPTPGPVYEFYILTGAKMWITNGSIATQFCLYAQTPEGVTGFMVDRHAEGLKVGADEKKTGQRGSPTNEISIDSARVPREAVIGYEGHGQVNALETLNVGRCGLAVVSGALMRKLMQEAATGHPCFARTRPPARRGSGRAVRQRVAGLLPGRPLRPAARVRAHGIGHREIRLLRGHPRASDARGARLRPDRARPRSICSKRRGATAASSRSTKERTRCSAS